MLTKDGVIAHYIFAFCCFFLSGSQMITGNLATISGVLGTVELATALLRYSPIHELLYLYFEKQEIKHENKPVKKF